LYTKPLTGEHSKSKSQEPRTIAVGVFAKKLFSQSNSHNFLEPMEHMASILHDEQELLSMWCTYACYMSYKNDELD
jgi:hypothetical protein